MHYSFSTSSKHLIKLEFIRIDEGCPEIALANLCHEKKGRIRVKITDFSHFCSKKLENSQKS